MDHHDEEFLRRAQAARARIKEIEPQQVDASLASGAVAIDVREPGEYQKGSLPSARNVALDSITRQIEGVAPDKGAPMVCFCNGGNRGALAAAQLEDLGYTNVQSIAGGLRAYQKANDTSESSA